MGSVIGGILLISHARSSKKEMVENKIQTKKFSDESLNLFSRLSGSGKVQWLGRSIEVTRWVGRFCR